MTGKIEHLNAEALTDLVLGEISDDRKTEAATHLADCRRCAATARRTEQVLLAMRSDRTEAVPSYLSERVIDLFDTSFLNNAKPNDPTLIEKLTAMMTFDKLVPMTGLRSGSDEFVRQMIFAAGEMLFEMGLEQTGLDHWRIVGSARIPFVGGVVQLEDADGHLVSSQLDDLASFTFSSLSSGSYSAIFLHDHIRIEFQPRIVI